MDLEVFESNLLSHLREGQENQCIYDIDTNEEIIRKYLSHKTPKYCDKFLQKFNEIVVKTNDNFALIEKVLIHDFFSFVLVKFKKSNVMIRACIEGNEESIKWLLTMDIDLRIKDENGMTALMHAVRVPNLVSIVSYFIDNDRYYKSLNLTDNNEQTALFHAVHNLDAFKILLDSGINVNHLDNENDSVLTFCCKNNIYDPIKILSENENVYFNIYNNDEHTAAMYLVRDGRYKELTYIIQNSINLDFKNGMEETALSFLIQPYYECYRKENLEAIKPYLEILKILVEQEVNFNVAIDEEGNTPFMFFLSIHDWYTVLYLLIQCKNLDLSVKNKRGVSATSLSSAIKPEIFSRNCSINVKALTKLLLHHKTFDLDFKDKYGNNLAMYFLLYNKYENFSTLLKRNYKLISDVNDNEENLLIATAKLHLREFVKSLIYTEGNNINQQDHLGNTALHYAVESKDKYIADMIAFYHAPIDIRNHQGITPLDMALECTDEEMADILQNPILPYKVLKREKKKSVYNIFRKSRRFEDDSNVSISRIQFERYKIEYEERMVNRVYSYHALPDRSYFYYQLQQLTKSFYKILNVKGKLTVTEDLIEEVFDLFGNEVLDMVVSGDSGYHGGDSGTGDIGDAGGDAGGGDGGGDGGGF